MYPFPNHYIRIYNVMVSYFIPNQTTAYLPRIEWANDFWASASGVETWTNGGAQWSRSYV